MSFLGWGKPRALPENSHGNLPDFVSEKDQGHNVVIDDIIENPPLLTKTLLIEQLGEELAERDPFRFWWVPAEDTPCLRRSKTYAIAAGSIIAALTAFKTRSIRRTLDFGVIAAFIGGYSVWIPCRWNLRKQRLYADGHLY